MEDSKKIVGKKDLHSDNQGDSQDKHWLSEDENEDSEDGLEGFGEHPDFYDSEADDEDEKWVQTQRKGRNSDAILSCPCCFQILTLDCQRHEQYTHQYRAMFVQNCEVDSTQRLRMTQGKRGGSSAAEPPPREGEDAYHPVKCATCKTEVGLYDHDEMYHFFNAFPSCS